MTILAIVNAEKEGQIESKMIKARQMEEIREAKRKEAEARAEKKKSKLVRYPVIYAPMLFLLVANVDNRRASKMNFETRRREDQATVLQKIRNPASSLERSGRVSRLLEAFNSFISVERILCISISMCAMYACIGGHYSF